MRKHLILVLALVLAVGFTCAAYAEVQNVKVSGDITALGILRQLSFTNNEGLSSSTHNDQAMASITRVKVDADLTDNVMATVRLLNERYWGAETVNGSGADSATEISLDLAYVTLKEFLYSPLTMTIGRQELHFGNDMIVGDPDTNNTVNAASAFNSTGDDQDLSARKSFDAIRATLNYDPLVVDLVSATVSEGTKNAADDTSLYGINAAYAVSKTTNVEGYVWSKHEGGKAFTGFTNDSGKPRTTNVVGARVVTSPIANLVYQLEGAYQFGRYHVNDDDQDAVARQAWALETGLSYDFKNVKYVPSVRAGYMFFSGERNDYITNDGAYHAWDPMYENQSAGDIANALFSQSNVQIGTLGVSTKLTDDLSLKGDYYAYWWVKPYQPNVDGPTSVTTARGNTVYMTANKFVGQEIDLKATYDYTEDVQFSLLTGLYLPGRALAGNSRNTATEVIGSMKVTF